MSPFLMFARRLYDVIRRRCAKDGIEASRILSPDFTLHDKDGYAIYETPCVNVMLISWHENVARREALGWVFLTQWIKMKPEFRTIVLE